MKFLKILLYYLPYCLHRYCFSVLYGWCSDGLLVDPEISLLRDVEHSVFYLKQAHFSPVDYNHPMRLSHQRTVFLEPVQSVPDNICDDEGGERFEDVRDAVAGLHIGAGLSVGNVGDLVGDGVKLEGRREVSNHLLLCIVLQLEAAKQLQGFWLDADDRYEYGPVFLRLWLKLKLGSVCLLHCEYPRLESNLSLLLHLVTVR